VPASALQSLGELLDRLRLIALGFKIGYQPELSLISIAQHQKKRIAAPRWPDKPRRYLPAPA